MTRPDHRHASTTGTDATSLLPASPIVDPTNQGEHVRPTEHIAATPSTPRTGFRATLRALATAKGTRAPRSTSTDGTGAPKSVSTDGTGAPKSVSTDGTGAPKSTSTDGTGAPSPTAATLGPSALRASFDTRHEQVHPTGHLGVPVSAQTCANFSHQHRQVHPASLASDNRLSRRTSFPFWPSKGDEEQRDRGRRPRSVLLHMRGRGQRYLPLLVVLSALAAPCAASANEPWFHAQSATRPSFLAPESENGEVVATVTNLGDASTTGTVTITDTLPAGLSAKTIEAEVQEGVGGEAAKKLECSKHPLLERPLVCTVIAGKAPSASLTPYQALEIRIGVTVDPGATVCKQNASNCEQNEVSVSSPGAPSLSISRPVTISEEQLPFGVESYEVTPEEEGGSPTTQAGAHPFQVTGTLTMNQTAVTPIGFKDKLEAHPVAQAKDLAGLLPPGLIGNPTPFPKCSVTQLDNQSCPPDSVIGVASVNLNEPSVFGGLTTFTSPIVNMEPAQGEAARFGFFAAILPVFLDAHVRSGGDYGVTLSSSDISQAAAFLSYKLTFWGVPGVSAHNSARSNACLRDEKGCAPFEELSPPPLLAMPTACTGPLHTSTEADAWDEPLPEGQRHFFAETEPMPAMTGCSRLPFEAQVKVTPDGTAASTPTGLSVDVHVPQGSILDATGLASSAVRDITVTLPEGVQVNPAGGNGLQACSEGLVGWQGFRTYEDEPGVSVGSFTPALPEPEEPGINFCSTASKIGTVEISTPLLPVGQHLVGSVYLASQNQNPFGSLLALYLVAKDPVSGTVFKAVGKTTLTSSGQIVGTFENNPQLAFEDATLHFFGGERGPLSTPSRCGAYTTTARFVPWAAEEWDEASETINTSSPPFDITTGPHGSPCTYPGQPLPFSPSLTAGTINNNAGGFSELSTTIGREDGQQNLQQVTLHMPAGLSGALTGVALCPEAQANAGECGPESLIGETTVQAGVGSDPVSVKGGKVYLTEKYEGAPFGLSIVNPVKAGPFDLEHDTSNPNQDPPCDCVVVRAKIEVNQLTAALTITTNSPSEGYNIPDMIDGIPVQIKAVNVTITRPGFTFNPTNCNPTEITGTISSDEGGSSPVSVPFQVTNCAALKFTPALSVYTSAHSSKADGASLTFRIAYPKGAIGSESWFHYAQFDIPKQLPVEQRTLTQACLAATFEHDRAACPEHSIIGHAIVHTPVLPVPLEGPLYFVSYGSAKFPDAVLVLKGYGVTIELDGHTFINNKLHITSATYEALPDVPFESIEVTLPQGPYSEFGTNLPNESYDFCGQNMTMPVQFKASNGMEIHQSTPVQVTGCPPVQSAGKPKHTKKAHKARKTKKTRRSTKASRASRRRKGTRARSRARSAASRPALLARLIELP